MSVNAGTEAGTTRSVSQIHRRRDREAAAVCERRASRAAIISAGTTSESGRVSAGRLSLASPPAAALAAAEERSGHSGSGGAAARRLTRPRAVGIDIFNAAISSLKTPSDFQRIRRFESTRPKNLSIPFGT